MMGVPLDELTYMYGDNMSILHNVGNPESTLKKKSNNLIAYHMVQEAMPWMRYELGMWEQTAMLMTL